jgi:hypothetical protein
MDEVDVLGDVFVGGVKERVLGGTSRRVFETGGHLRIPPQPAFNAGVLNVTRRVPCHRLVMVAEGDKDVERAVECDAPGRQETGDRSERDAFDAHEILDDSSPDPLRP